MSTDLDASFNDQFTNIKSKLKRKFMRKPNLAECAKEFVALGVRCEYSEQPTLAGHSYAGAAKCAASMGDAIEEFHNNLEAAKFFMRAEQKLRSMRLFSPDRENLESAIGCYISAFKKQAEGTALSQMVYMRLANELEQLGYLEEALHYYTLSTKHITNDYNFKLNSYQHKLRVEVDLGRYEEAWRTVNELEHYLHNSGHECYECFYDLYLEELQINRILLTLITKPPIETQPESLKQLMGDLMNGNPHKEARISNPDLILKLQSIMLCVASGDVQTLVALSADLSELFSERQEKILQDIIRRERQQHLALT